MVGEDQRCDFLDNSEGFGGTDSPDIASGVES